MSRHRNVRSMNIDDEYAGYDDVYGHSVEDDFCVSPATAAQFIYNRDGGHEFAHYMRESEIPEEEEGRSSENEGLNDSGRFKPPVLSDTDQARLSQCLEEMHNVLGESHPECDMIVAIMNSDFNCERALNALLSKQEEPKPQRQARETRRSRTEASAATSTAAIPPLQPVPQSAIKTNKSQTIDTSTPCIASSDVTTVSDDVTAGMARMTFTKDTTVKTRGFHILDEGTTENGKHTDRDNNNMDSLQVNIPERGSVSPRSGSPRSGSPNKNDSSSDNVCYTPSRRMSERRGSRQVDRVDITREIEKRKTDKDHMNLVVIGHVDAGKSTLMGHVLYQLGVVSKRNMHKYEQEAKKVGKASFAYAWVLDETEEERSRGVTMDIAKTQFTTDHKNITLLDAPGHKDFIPNMITGAAQADVAVLVVNSTRGEFETGFETGGQTREHALLVRSLGVSQMVIAVNKMDTVDYSQSRYQEIVKKLGAFLKQAGFKDTDLSYVPCSGFTGDNLTLPSSNESFSWYSGHTLVQQIDKLRPADRLVEKSFRLCVGDVYKGQGSGLCVSGRVEAGTVQTGDRILVMPSSQMATLKGIQQNEELEVCAIAGDYVNLTVTGIDIDRITLGSILCDPTAPIYASTRITARVVIFNIDIPLTKGFPVVFHYQTMSEPAVIHKLVSLLHKSTGEVIKSKPRCLMKNCSAVLELDLSRPCCVELYKDYKNLGRFMMRYAGSTIGAGLVTKLKSVKS